MPDNRDPHPTDTLWALALSVNAVTDRLDRIATPSRTSERS